jgi:pyridoxamine 5'-phosphate oxidase
VPDDHRFDSLRLTLQEPLSLNDVSLNDVRFADQLPAHLPDDPMHWADAWLKEAEASSPARNPNSMTLVSVDPDGAPSARIVLCKNFVPHPGYLVFYTNYRSRKAQEIAANPKVACVFHWDAPGRQVRIEGIAVQSPASESDTYFATRDWGSQLGAWGSDQSEPLASRDALIAQIRARAQTLSLELGEDTQTLASGEIPLIPRPPHWGGYRVWANVIELWKEGPKRVHDRARWSRSLVRASEHEFTVSGWTGHRLQP